jgi:aspartate/methionine/tyrosine aminotransferase
MLDYLADLLHEGVSISPGAAFGEVYENWVRVCYMSVPRERLEQAIDRLNRSFDRLRRREPLRHDGPRTLTL